MIITTNKDMTAEELVPLKNSLADMGAEVYPVEWKGNNVLILSGGNVCDTDVDDLKGMGMDSSVSLSKQYKLISREFDPADTLVQVGDAVFGGKQIHVIAGPCSVESPEQMQTVAREIKKSGCRLIRGGAYKPRTSPYSFQGHGEYGLELIHGAADRWSLPVVTELTDPRHLELFVRYGVGAIQIGTRNMQNFDLLKEVGQTRIPVILKRGMSATLSEWFMAAEYIAAGGNQNIILCERGIRTFETAYRNVLDVTSVIVAKKETNLPVIIDPSHAGGKSWMVSALAKSAIAVGADGLLIEAHPTPSLAWTDADQTISLEALDTLMGELDAVAKAVGRTLL